MFGSVQKCFLDLLHIQWTFIWRTWTYAGTICGSCQDPDSSHCVPGLSSFVHLANTAAELERHHSGGLVKAPPSRLRSASTLAAVQLPTDNNWHRWWAETQDRQRKTTTHSSKKTGRLYTHCPREDIAWQYYQLIYFEGFFCFFLFNLFFLFLLFKMILIFFFNTCHMRIRGL